MLSPEVWNFNPPPSSLKVRETPCVQPDTDDEPNRSLKKHYFNHSVCVVLPDALNVPQNLIDTILQDSMYYKLKAVPLFHFVNQEFIYSFVKSGEVTAISIETWLDIDNCAAITPSGVLVLSLRKETFQKLGMEKGPAISVYGGDEFTQVHINLKEECFKADKKNYLRALKQLTLNKELTMDVIINWEPDDVTVCPSTLAKYFTTLGIEVAVCKPKQDLRIEYTVLVPAISTPHEELLEWFGAFCIGFKKGNDSEGTLEFLSSFSEPEDCEEVGQVTFAQWSGLFTTKRVYKFFTELYKYVQERCSSHWLGMHVAGFSDSPVSWGLKPHIYHMNGENNYTLILDPSGKVITFLDCTEPYKKNKKK